MTLRFALTSTAALALAACGTNEPADTATSEATATDTAATIETPPPPDTSSPQGFVDTLAASDKFEIEAGKLAQQMGKSQKVKDFGAMMVKDHTASSDKLTAAVADAGNNLTVAPTLSAVQQSKLDQLRTASDDFDAMYAQQQVQAHEDALSVLQAQAQTGTVAQLKAFAAAVVPVVQGHLEHARALP